MMACIVLIASEGVRNHGDREAQIFLEHFGLRHVCRNFAEHIVVVPRINEAHVLTAVTQCANDKINRHTFAEVADVYRARRCNAGSTLGQRKVHPLLDDLIRHLVSPVTEMLVGFVVSRNWNIIEEMRNLLNTSGKIKYTE